MTQAIEARTKDIPRDVTFSVGVNIPYKSRYNHTEITEVEPKTKVAKSKALPIHIEYRRVDGFNIVRTMWIKDFFTRRVSKKEGFYFTITEKKALEAFMS